MNQESMNQADDPPAIVKRQICATCQRPQRTCICHWITRVEPLTEVLILQHPLEVADAKGSARLLHLCLPGSRMVTGELFEEQELKALLQAPFDDRHVGTESLQTVRHTVLLYPDTPNDQVITMSKPPVLDPALLRDPAELRLIVLDGTWRKSRKMLYLNPLLQQLPRLALRNPPASQYLIRKAHDPGQLSTLEAACYALMQLEGNSEKYAPLLGAFNGFVEQQLAYVDAN
jgi:DTW domain-containing protein YfiP